MRARGEAARELSGLTYAELQRRNKILTQTICEAVGVSVEAIHPQMLYNLIGLSPLVRAIKDCEPQDNPWVRTRSAADRAADLLAKFDRMLAEQGKEI